MVEDVDGVVHRLGAALTGLRAAGDPARFFLGTYLRTTLAVGAALRGGTFEDPAWVEAWDVDFAGRYLDALQAHLDEDGVPPGPWRLAFGAGPGLRPEVHVLLGMNAHINYDLPQSLIAVIPPAEFADPRLLARRHRDHERIDAVLAARVAAEDAALQRDGSPRMLLDRALAPANRMAGRLLLREARRTVWANTGRLHEARLGGPAVHARRLADLEDVSARRVRDLLRPGPVLLRLALFGFGVPLPENGTLSEDVPPPRGAAATGEGQGGGGAAPGGTGGGGSA